VRRASFFWSASARQTSEETCNLAVHLLCSLLRDLLPASIGFGGTSISRSRSCMKPQSPIWQTEFGDGPLVACAIHDGHDVRPEVADCLRLDSAQRLYEEDPYTGEWTSIAPTRIVARRSRFEVDFNRSRDKAVYITPVDAWGLDVWRC